MSLSIILRIHLCNLHSVRSLCNSFLGLSLVSFLSSPLLPCVSCHHAGLVVWAMREAKQRGHAVNEPVLAELTKWIAEAGDGKTGVPRPAGLPKALNAKAVWLALALGADAKPDA